MKLTDDEFLLSKQIHEEHEGEIESPEDEQPLDEDEELERAIPPPLYTCIHKDDKRCEFWDLHTEDPYYYDYVDDQTPCHFCGHTGTLKIYP